MSILERAPATTILLAVSLLANTTLFAQQGGAAADTSRGVFPPTSQEYQVLWRELEAGLAKSDYDVVLDRLDEFITLAAAPRDATGDAGVVSNDAGLALGIRALLRRTIDALPARRRAQFIEALDAALHERWDEPAGPTRAALRHRILRDCPESSLRAAVLQEEVDFRVLQGEWAAARAVTRALSELVAAAPDAFDSQTRVRTLAVALEVARAVGDRSAFEAHRTALRTAVDAAGSDEIPAALERHVRRLLEIAPPTALARGESTRNALLAPVEFRESLTSSAYRLGAVLWRHSSRNPGLERFVSERLRTRNGRGARRADVPVPFFPSLRAGRLLLQHENRVSAHDAHSGRPLWTYEFGTSDGLYSAARAPVATDEVCFVEHAGELLALELDSGELLWRTRFAYDLTTRELRPLTERTALAERRYPDAVEERWPDSVPDLDFTPDQGSGQRVRLAPPVIDGDAIIVPVHIRLDRQALCWLVRLDRRGEPRFETFLGTARGADFLGLGATGSPPWITRGDGAGDLGIADRLVYVSNLGFIACVDPFDGTIFWLREYASLTTRGLQESIRDENRWHVNPVVPLPGGSEVLVAPQDSPALLAVRVADGATTWSAFREEHSTIVGVTESMCVIGGARLRGIRIAGPSRGETAWVVDPTAAAPARAADRDTASDGDGAFEARGRALLLHDRVLVPTADHLVTIDASNGAVLATDLWDFSGAGGNLLLVDNRLAVIHASGFLLYEEFAESLARIEAIPDGEPARWLRLARLRLRSGDADGGIDALDSWQAAKPERPRANSPLDRLQLEVAEVVRQAARTAPAPTAARLLRLRSAVESAPSRKVEAAIDEALWLERSGDPRAALDALHRALSYDVGPGDAADERAPKRSRYFVADYLPVASEDFVRERLRQVRAAVDDPAQEFAALETRALTALRDAQRKGALLSLQEVLRLYPFTRAASQAYRDVVNHYLDHGNTDLAVRTLLDALAEFGDTGSDEAVRFGLEAAHLLYDSGEGTTARAHRRARARQLYETLRDRYADKRITGVRGLIAGETVGAYIDRRLHDPGLREVAARDGGELRVPLAMAWRSPADLMAPEKTFLLPGGELPAAARACFFTQEREVVECTNAATGLPVWTVHLASVPKFALDRPLLSFPYARRGDKELRGRFIGDLLILHDHRNLFAISHARGKVVWHVPFGDGDQGASPSGRLRLLRERIRGAQIDAEGIRLTTSRQQLIAFDLDGRKLWNRALGFDPSADDPLRAGDELFILRRRPVAWTAFAIRDGEPRPVFSLPGGTRPLPRMADPIDVGEGRVLFPQGGELSLLDLARRRVEWSFRGEHEAQIQNLFWDARSNDVLVVLQRTNGWPVLLSLAVRDGRERWRYDKFPVQRTRFNVVRDILPGGREQVFVIHGEDSWKLLALQVGPAQRADRAAASKVLVDPLWPRREVDLGRFFSIGRQRQLHVAQNALIFPDPDLSVSILDRQNGTLLDPPPNLLSRFLLGKGSYRTAVIDGRLIVLTDQGAAGFASAASVVAVAREPDRPPNAHVRPNLDAPSDSERITALALEYFRTGELDTAMLLLDRSLESEAVLTSPDLDARERLTILLEGIQQEAMRALPSPQIAARHMREAPEVDGVLDDAWSYSYRLRLTAPRNIHPIPAPGLRRKWDGEEDLSAILYSGWDDDYFYFALDVDDDVLRAFDRDAENWRGDCLLIGLDPEGDGGFRRGGDDQLMTLALTLPKRQKDKDRGDDDDAPDDDDDGGGDDDDDGADDIDRPDGLYSVKKKDDNSGAIYECAIPWNSFPAFEEGRAEPSPGYEFGLSLLLTDDDSGRGATKTLSLNPCHRIPRKQRNAWIWRFLVPEFFPRVQLRQ